MSEGILGTKVTMFHFLAVLIPGYLVVSMTVLLFGSSLSEISKSLFLPAGIFGATLLSILFLISGPIIGYAIYGASIPLIRCIYIWRKIDIPESDYLDIIAPPHIFMDILDLVGIQFFAIGNCIVLVTLVLAMIVCQLWQVTYVPIHILFALVAILLLYLAIDTTDRVESRYDALKKYERKRDAVRGDCLDESDEVIEPEEE